jgi:hypothetical protein
MPRLCKEYSRGKASTIATKLEGWKLPMGMSIDKSDDLAKKFVDMKAYAEFLEEVIRSLRRTFTHGEILSILDSVRLPEDLEQEIIK